MAPAEPQDRSAEDNLQIFDRVSQREVDLLMIALLDCAEGTHIPELYAIFGKDAFLKFLDLFAGATIVCPPRDVLNRSVRNVGIYLRILQTPDGSKARVVRDLATKYRISQSRVLQTFVDMEQRLKRYKIT